MRLYTDHDGPCCAVLAERVRCGDLAPGDVVCADVRDIGEAHVRGRTEVHLFAGMGGGPMALLAAAAAHGLEVWPEHLPILTGGFPCQDISSAGKGAGLDGERSGLFWELCRVADIFKPACILAENVSALSARGLDRVAGALERVGRGYDVVPMRVGAWAVGSPQERERWWIVGLARDVDAINPGDGLADSAGVGCEAWPHVEADQHEAAQAQGGHQHGGLGGIMDQHQLARLEGHGADAGQPEVAQPGHTGRSLHDHRWVHARWEAWSEEEERWVTVLTPQHQHEVPRLFRGTRTISAAWRCQLMGYPAWWLDVPADELARLRPEYAGKPEKLARWWNKEGIKMTGNAWVPQVAAQIAAGMLDVVGAPMVAGGA